MAPGEEDRTEGAGARGAAGLAAILVAAALLFWAAMPSFYVGFFNDDVIYVALARSMAQGTGYTDIQHPHPGPHKKYPPGFPLLLAPFQAAAPEALDAMRWVGFLCALGSVALTWRLCRGRPGASRWAPALLLALNPFLARYATTVLSDVPFMAALLAYLLLLRQAMGEGDPGALVSRRRPPPAAEPSPAGPGGPAPPEAGPAAEPGPALAGTPGGRARRPPPAWAGAAAGLAAAALFYLRTVGAVVVAATVLWLLLRRRGLRFGLLLVAVFAAAALPFVLGPGRLGYEGDLVLNYGARGLEIPLSNLRFYLAGLPLALWADPVRLMATALGPEPQPFLWVALLATWGLVGTGLWTRIYRDGLSPEAVLLPLYGLFFLLWPYADIRFFLPVLPLLYMALVDGLETVVRRPRLPAGALTAAVAVLAASEMVFASLAVLDARTRPSEENTPPREAYRWIRENTEPRAPVLALRGAVWLYTGRPVAVLPPWPGSPDAALEAVYRSGADWFLANLGEGPLVSQYAGRDEWLRFLEGDPERFPQALRRPDEAVALFRVEGDRERFLGAYDRFSQGVREAIAGRPAQAEKAFREALEAEPSLAGARFNLAVVQHEAGRSTEAAANLRELLQHHPDHARGRALLEQLETVSPPPGPPGSPGP